MRAAQNIERATVNVVPNAKRLELLAVVWAGQTGRPINALGLVVKP